MIRRTALLLAALALPACGAEHLGAGFGRSFDAAFEAQTGKPKAGEDSASALDAEDAKNTLAVRHGGTGKDQQGGQAAPAASSTAIVIPGSSSSGSGQQLFGGPAGSDAPMHLEAK